MAECHPLSPSTLHPAMRLGVEGSQQRQKDRTERRRSSGESRGEPRHVEKLSWLGGCLSYHRHSEAHFLSFPSLVLLSRLSSQARCSLTCQLHWCSVPCARWHVRSLRARLATSTSVCVQGCHHCLFVPLFSKDLWTARSVPTLIRVSVGAVVSNTVSLPLRL